MARGDIEEGWVEIKGLFVHVTDDAVLIQIDKERVWIPRSQIDEDDNAVLVDHDRGDEIEIKIKEWIAVEKGLV